MSCMHVNMFIFIVILLCFKMAQSHQHVIGQSGNGIRQLKQVVEVSIPNSFMEKTLLG